MKSLLIYIAIGLLFSCKAKPKEIIEVNKPVKDTILNTNSTPFLFTFFDTPGHTISPNKKLIEAWQSFVQAVQANDTALIKNLSASCVACENCETENDHHISINDFLRIFYTSKFNENLKIRMTDSSKVKAHYDLANRHIYSDPCISRGMKKESITIIEFFVKIADRTEEFEGGDAAFAFIDTPAGYKFCGYSTIP